MLPLFAVSDPKDGSSFKYYLAKLKLRNACWSMRCVGFEKTEFQSSRSDDKTFRVSNYWLMCYSNCDSEVWVYYKNSRALDSFAIYLNRMGDTRNIFTTSEFQASIFSSFLLFFYRFQMKWNLLFESLIFWQLLLPYFQLLTEMLYDTLRTL